VLDLSRHINNFINDAHAETSAKMLLSLTVIQLYGWNIQWAKTSLEPTQQLHYLGFVTDTVKMRPKN
jgi:hypothetical protein